MDADKIRNIAEEELAEGSLFLVEVNITPGNEIEVVIDSDGSVDIDDCVALSRAIEERLDREEEDFELTVTSAGIGRPLRLLRQYRKLIGHPVEVVLLNGTKIIAELRDARRGFRHAGLSGDAGRRGKETQTGIRCGADLPSFGNKEHQGVPRFQIARPSVLRTGPHYREI